MNAPSPSRSPRPTAGARRPSQKRSQVKRLRNRRPRSKETHAKILMVELGLKLAVNVVISGAAIAGLVKLLPYNLSQQSKLQEIQGEVAQTEARVNALQQQFARNFSPSHTEEVIQEQSPMLPPGQRRIVWTEPQSDRPVSSQIAQTPPEKGNITENP